jgi:uncharacterized membrane protein YczE
MATHVSRATLAGVLSDHGLIGRLSILAAGTAAMGCGIALLMRSRLGMVPMDVLHAGVGHAFGWTLGKSIIACQSLAALTLIPLRIRPGIGTAAGFLIPAVVADRLLDGLPVADGLPGRVAALVIGGLLFCFGVAVYLRADLGRLPRDEIMLAFAGARHDLGDARSRRIALVRVGIDVAFVAVGAALLGPANAVHTGALAPGTVLMAGGSGPLIALFLSLIARVPGFSLQCTRAARRRGTGRHRRAQRANTRGGRA